MGNLQETVSRQFAKKEIPSITEQTPWPVKFMSFGKAGGPGIRFFNSAIYQRGDELWVIARKAVGASKDSMGVNTIVAFLLDQSLTPSHYIEVYLSNRSYKGQHFEDPRITTIGGQPWLSYCTFQIFGKEHYSGAHQQVAVLNDMWQPIHIWDPLYGGNGGSILMVERNQKNWTWFEYGGKPHLVYNIEDHEVVQWNGQEVGKVYETPCKAWKHGHKRGGTSPVLVGDEYFCFFHSSTFWKWFDIPDEETGNFNRVAKNRYHMGAYAFEAKPPFRITRMTTKPILSGSDKDPWVLGLPAVAFPCGAVLQRNKWLVTMGVNDYCTAVIEIPHYELTRLLK